MCLGTDSLASNRDLSVFAEMNLFTQKWPTLNPYQIVCMTTINGARALGAGKEWLEWQDWIAIPAPFTRSTDIWDAITHFTGKPYFVMVDGQIISTL